MTFHSLLLLALTAAPTEQTPSYSGLKNREVIWFARQVPAGAASARRSAQAESFARLSYPEDARLLRSCG